SVGGTLCAEVAAFSHASVRRLVLIAPLGLFDEREPVADIWAQRLSELPALLSTQPEELAAFLEAPEGADAVEWQILLARADEAAARLLWPTGDRGLHKRLHRIVADTLLLWGSEDRVVPATTAKRFAAALPGRTQIQSIEGAGHMAEIDRPEAVAESILRFLD
ncbi:MAG: alpha/beta fold hydrolase, partial [Myxococcota bacterium]